MAQAIPNPSVNEAVNESPNALDIEKELNYWFDSSKPKDEPEVKERLERFAKSGHSMSGFQLRSANLIDIDLVNRGSKTGYDLSHADFYRANLTHAHMFRINLQGASLMKAKLIGANLHCANLEDCNLLGADFSNAKLENINWGDQILQEKKAIQAEKEGDKDKTHMLYQEAEEVYRNIRKACENQGLFESAGKFFYREMTMRRRQLPAFSPHRVLSKTVDLFCGYGEKPLRVVTFSLTLIALCACLYFLFGIEEDGGITGLNTSLSLWDNLRQFGGCLYFSVVTFTTLGYGDITPLGMARPIAAIEAFSGSFTMALFVVVFVKKMTR
ncbi:pentapeptide repeat-containing protein [Spartinivicinus ruber]|uniref:pentapeptide repeat-containing protein n=1 Tax=Spartinivicinus ruber TaxID=2683272 RepID=UPI0013D2577C|nr:pentapeptide repeat-containing protein [Spartinivicinus ruber]